MLVIGVMSGTSLDGIDLALCDFEGFDPVSYKLLSAITLEYDKEWKQELSQLHTKNGLYLCSMNVHYGRYIAFQILRFMESEEFKNAVQGYSNESVQNLIISSHGHTIFHEPDTGLTLQLGHGATIMALTGFNVVCDFRSQDVALGGQGAPLVPIGDELLFGEYDACLNLGGFANISLHINGKRRAWDICPVNFVLNRWAERLGDSMDRNGMYSSKGKFISELYQQWENIEYYKKPPPKSLGREWIENIFLDQIYEPAFDPRDLMHTAIEHIVKRISSDIPKTGKVLVTGGGAYHPLLIKKLKESTSAELIIPNNQIVEYKEAIIFALMGYLRWHDRINVLSSVTGAMNDHSSGVIYKKW
ncbi:MAG: anhydro-N-acetylmuramic acid kinase [Thermaurantimonas sp.]|uniref:anhydro-N-acetylmuramic acid kinase n=1 Tax=Thermaurantimonas sp. TaxID=2681568 RepID=UPI00391DC49B